MKIQKQHMHHGAALAQIIYHGPFSACAPHPDGLRGHIRVNGDRNVMIKYATGDRPWQFTFKSEHLEALQKDAEDGPHTYAVLVCSDKTICALALTELVKVIDLGSTKQQTIWVSNPVNGCLRASGSYGELKRTMPHNSFPDKIFAHAE